MASNNFLARQQAIMDEHMHIAERVTRQYDTDTLQIALARYDKLRLGYQRIMEITELWAQVRDEYFPALSGGVEADVARDHLDRELLQIAKDPSLVLPFDPRYPEMKKIRYDKKKKH